MVQSNVWDQDEYDKHLAGLAGQLYSEDEQCELLRGDGSTLYGVSTVLPATSDSDVMFCLQVIRGLESIDLLCINPIHRIGLIHK